MEILHTTGIHKQVRGSKEGEKKRFNLLPPQKGEIRGLTFFSTFFSIVEKTGNTQMLASWYKTYIRHFGKDAEKKGGER